MAFLLLHNYTDFIKVEPLILNGSTFLLLSKIIKDNFLN